MADIYELPEDVTRLTDEDLEANLSAAVRSFKAESTTTVVTQNTLPNLRSLKASIETLKEERKARTAAAEAAAAEIDQLAADVFGEDETEAEAEATEIETEAAEAEASEVIEPTAIIEPAAVTASARRSLNLAAVRAKQSGSGSLSRYLPVEEPTGVEIVASVDVPGFRPGEGIDIDQIVEGAMRRATGLKTSGGGTGMVASYRMPFPDALIVKDSSSAPEGSKAVMLAAKQSRLPQGDLVASGGWCAPSETIYDIASIACPDMLWDAPEVQLNRGGLRFFRTPTLDVAALTWTWTEADDIAAATQPAGPEKPCFVIPCPAPIDVRAEAIGVCLSVGILTQRFFPEMVDWYVRNAMVAHEIRVKSEMYIQARNSAATLAVTIPATGGFATFSAVYGAVALQAADMIERHNLCESTELEVTFPWWLRNMMLTDIARRDGKDPLTVCDDDIQAAFSCLGVRVQFARGLVPDVPTNIGGAVPATAWPADVEFLIYPSGNFQIGRGPEVNLGVIIDSVTVATNDEKIFSEEAVVLIDRMGLARRVTVTVCANGEVGARTTTEICPVIP